MAAHDISLMKVGVALILVLYGVTRWHLHKAQQCLAEARQLLDETKAVLAELEATSEKGA